MFTFKEDVAKAWKKAAQLIYLVQMKSDCIKPYNFLNRHKVKNTHIEVSKHHKAINLNVSLNWVNSN